MFQHALLNEILAFIAVADLNSFTAAAEQLHTTKSSVGKAIQKLEQDLAVKLFHRSTRTVRLTEEGTIYLEACRQAINLINQAKTQLDARQSEPTGQLRVNLPVGIGKAVIDTLADFIETYPKVTIEISLSDKFEAAIAGDWDVVVRIGELSDSSMVAKKLCTTKPMLYAAPKYIEQYGAPTSIADLSHHNALLFRAPDGKIRHWQLRQSNGQLMDIPMVPGAVFSDGRTLIDAVINGLGIAQLYDKSVPRNMVEERLIPILPHMTPDSSPIHALLPAGRSMPAKTRAFVDFLAEVFSD